MAEQWRFRPEKQPRHHQTSLRFQPTADRLHHRTADRQERVLRHLLSEADQVQEVTTDPAHHHLHHTEAAVLHPTVHHTAAAHHRTAEVQAATAVVQAEVQAATAVVAEATAEEDLHLDQGGKTFEKLKK